MPQLLGETAQTVFYPLPFFCLISQSGLSLGLCKATLFSQGGFISTLMLLWHLSAFSHIPAVH